MWVEVYSSSYERVVVKMDKNGMISIQRKDSPHPPVQIALAKAYLVSRGIFEEQDVKIDEAEALIARSSKARRVLDSALARLDEY